ncbi:hypothetical protein I7I53_02710 [Histoplasma capsulatum var. duboisii H88]|uniref:Uncharacterized protein n=1 Tax=Ajellomyces capsulatus (strain H88) TaxID=544711 RepID=A0A8A1LM98_AJEC8|nr:hypothetical protein I7I53_02710 [Histoplasma capsulatum var. duboisii H88]
MRSIHAFVGPCGKLPFLKKIPRKVISRPALSRKFRLSLGLSDHKHRILRKLSTAYMTCIGCVLIGSNACSASKAG